MTRTSLESELPQHLIARHLRTDSETTRHYAELTTDFNPIHVDAEFAAKTAFGSPIIHGTMGLNLLVEAIEETFGHPSADLQLDVRFIRPVPVGSVIRVGGLRSAEAADTYDIYVETEAGDRAVEGTCRVTPPQQTA